MATLELRANDIEYKGHTLRTFTVHIDGELVGDKFAPFFASSVAIHSRICEECYISSGHLSCSAADIAVRRRGDTVYWFLADTDHVDQLLPDVPVNHIWSFSREAYELPLYGDTSDLRGFSSADIRLILIRGTVFEPHLGLFTIPDLDDDPHGRRLLEFIRDIVNSGDLVVCGEPSVSRSIRIGIETTGIPETVIDVGRLDERFAVRFVANPSFHFGLRRMPSANR